MSLKEKRSGCTEYALISKYRKYIMGIAAIMIIICHNNLVIELWPWETLVKVSEKIVTIVYSNF